MLLSRLQQQLQRNRPQVQVDTNLLATMTEMGFPEQRSRRALRYFNNDVETAIQHVMSVPEAQDDSLFGPEPPSEPRAAQRQPSAAVQQPSAMETAQSSSMQAQPVVERRPAQEAPSDQMLEEFKADTDALNMLLEMGYARQDALIALKITSNNLE